MTDTVQASATTTSRATIARALGGHPFRQFAISAVKLFGGMAVVAGVLLLCGPAGVIIALLIAAAWTFLGFFALGRAVGALINGSRHFTPALESVEAGQLGCTYAVRGTICMGGIAVIDEPRRRIWLNGDLLGFDDISNVRWEAVGRRYNLNITAKRGAQPITKLVFDSEDSMRQSYARLCNTLGLV